MPGAWARGAALLLLGASVGLLTGGLLSPGAGSAALDAEVRRLRSENEALRQALSRRRLAVSVLSNEESASAESASDPEEAKANSSVGLYVAMAKHQGESVDDVKATGTSDVIHEGVFAPAAPEVANGLDLSKAFYLADKNHNGHLSRTEFQADLAKFGVHVNETESKKIIDFLYHSGLVFDFNKVYETVDRNKDGGLGVDELMLDASHFGVQVTDAQSHSIVDFLAHNAKRDPNVLGGYTYAAATHGKSRPVMGMGAAMKKNVPAGAHEDDDDASMLDTVLSVTGSYQAMAMVTVLLAAIFEVVHMAWAEVDLTQQMEDDIDHEELDQQTAINVTGIWSLLKLYWGSRESFRGWVLLVACVVLQVASIWIQAELVNITSIYWDAIQKKDMDAFFALLRAVLPFILFAIVQGAYYNYVWAMLQIKWRTALTVKLQRLWLQNKAFYKMRLLEGSGLASSMDNPEQRIESDVGMFVNSTLDLSFGIFNAVGQLAVFLPMLWAISPEHVLGIEGLSIPGWLCWISFFYAGFGTTVLHLIGQQLMRINYMQQQTQADFRAGLIRIREGAESIALCEAESWEEKRLGGLFARIQRIVWEGMRVNLRTQMFNSFYFMTSDLFPLFVLSPSYFAGHITLGVLNKAKTAQGTVLGSFSWFMGAYATLMNFRSTAFRLQEFFAVAESTSAETFGAADGKGGPSFECSFTQGTSSGVAFAGTVCLPTGRTLHEGVSLRVEPGTWAMLSGPSGCGKTTLLRALVGLWPFGTGNVQRPKDASMVPAESTARLLRGATLREVVCYPRPAGDFSDSEIESALRAVDLAVLLDAPKRIEDSSSDAGVGYARLSALPTGREYPEATSLVPDPAQPLDRTDDWALALSSGQRQRLEFAHLLCAMPELVILDEPTAHLPTAAAVQLLDTMKQLLPAKTTLLTVSHDPALAKCHDQQFVVSPDGISAIDVQVGKPREQCV